MDPNHRPALAIPESETRKGQRRFEKKSVAGEKCFLRSEQKQLQNEYARDEKGSVSECRAVSLSGNLTLLEDDEPPASSGSE